MAGKRGRPQWIPSPRDILNVKSAALARWPFGIAVFDTATPLAEWGPADWGTVATAAAPTNDPLYVRINEALMAAQRVGVVLPTTFYYFQAAEIFYTAQHEPEDVRLALIVADASGAPQRWTTDVPIRWTVNAINTPPMLNEPYDARPFKMLAIVHTFRCGPFPIGLTLRTRRGPRAVLAPSATWSSAPGSVTDSRLALLAEAYNIADGAPLLAALDKGNEKPIRKALKDRKNVDLLVMQFARKTAGPSTAPPSPLALPNKQDQPRSLHSERASGMVSVGQTFSSIREQAPAPVRRSAPGRGPEAGVFHTDPKRSRFKHDVFTGPIGRRIGRKAEKAHKGLVFGTLFNSGAGTQMQVMIPFNAELPLWFSAGSAFSGQTVKVFDLIGTAARADKRKDGSFTLDPYDAAAAIGADRRTVLQSVGKLSQLVAATSDVQHRMIVIEAQHPPQGRQGYPKLILKPEPRTGRRGRPRYVVRGKIGALAWADIKRHYVTLLKPLAVKLLRENGDVYRLVRQVIAWYRIKRDAFPFDTTIENLAQWSGLTPARVVRLLPVVQSYGFTAEVYRQDVTLRRSGDFAATPRQPPARLAYRG